MRRLGLYWLITSILLQGCKKDPSPALTPQEELSTFELASGLKIQLVAAEPLVQEPAVIKFDQKGRLWVVEMRSFMMDIDGTDQDQPLGRVSVLFDDDNDGQMDRSVVFADSLVLPRAIAFVEDGVLIAEDVPLWFYQDMDGDLIADHKFLVDSAYGRKGVIEHSPNGLLRGFDGWLYNAKSDHRYKKVGEEWVKDKTEFRGQWGISKDDLGRLYYNYNWSQLHADIVPPNYLSRNPNHTSTTGIDVGLTTNRSVFPIRPNLAANRGYLPETLDKEGKIKEFTSACSPFVYRGDLLPKEYLGNVFVCEPVGNLIKRNLVRQESYNLTAKYAYDSMEFLASKDERFRPVSLSSGPDGALYVADMYHGIIEDGQYMTEYLREMTIQRRLTTPIHCGRIWRIIPDNGFEDIPKIDPTTLNTIELVDLLSNQNGWYRDIAQQLIIERGDNSTFPLLERMVIDQDLVFTTRIHALWTLFGLNNPHIEIYFKALNDKNDHVRALAVRLLEGIVRNDKEMQSRYLTKVSELIKEESPVVDLQIALSVVSLDKAAKEELLAQITKKYFNDPLIRDAVLSSLVNEEFDFMNKLIEQSDWDGNESEKAIMIELLASASTRKADPDELLQLITDLEKADGQFDWKQRAILDGMSLFAMESETDPIQLSEQPNLFSKLENMEAIYQDKIQKISAMFDWQGKEWVTDNHDSVKFKVDPVQFANGRKHYLNVCSGCHGTDGKGLNRFGPPLRNSEWVLGSEKRLALLLIHGMQGPVTVAGKSYGSPDILPEMPSFSVFDDGKIAAIMTYIRSEWGHNAEPVSGRNVAGYRIRGQGKLTPWKAEELMEVSD
ncbi:MAG: c-type cytochrome [Bacteroidota bacterium]